MRYIVDFGPDVAPVSTNRLTQATGLVQYNPSAIIYCDRDGQFWMWRGNDWQLVVSVPDRVFHCPP